MTTPTPQTPSEPRGGRMWMISLGRVLGAFGLGVLAMRNYPGVAGPLGVPAAALGVVLLFAGGWGRRR